DSDPNDWSVLSCLEYLKDRIQFTSDSKEDILDAITRAFLRVSELVTTRVWMKKKAKKLYSNVKETFKRREIVEFFEFRPERDLERSFDRNGCKLLKKSGDFNTLKLSSRYAEKSTEPPEIVRTIFIRALRVYVKPLC
ncbi:2234_t:CDS:2, partial [Ambispora leptoticha]